MTQQKNHRKQKPGKKKQAWPMVLLFGIGLLLLVGAVFTFIKPSQTNASNDGSGTPVLKVNQEKVDLGDVKLGQTVKVSFDLTNIGDKTLKFAKAPYVEVLQGC